MIIDGDGVGEDRRINIVLKTFLRWCNADASDEKTINDNYLLSQLALSEFAVVKSELSEKMVNQELQNYRKISESFGTSIEMVKNQIELSKQNLILAKQIQQNKFQYSSLARQIKEQPERQEVMKKHQELKLELEILHERYRKVNQALNNRRKDFACFMNACNSLLTEYDAEVKSEEVEPSSSSSEGEDIDEEMLIDV